MRPAGRVTAFSTAVVPYPKKFPALEQPFYWKPRKDRQAIKFILWTAGIFLACTWFVSATLPVAPGPDYPPWGDIVLRLVILVPGLTYAADLVQRRIIRSPPEIADDDSANRWSLVVLVLVIIWFSFLPPEFTYPD